MPGIAAWIVVALGLIELRRLAKTSWTVGRRRQRRLVYRFEGEAGANCYSPLGYTQARLLDASATGLGLAPTAPLEVGARPAVMLDLHDAAGEPREVAAQIEVRSCREADGEYLVGATIVDIDADSRLALMEWCYVVCSHERLRGHRPSEALLGPEATVISLDDYREGAVQAPRPALPISLPAVYELPS